MKKFLLIGLIVAGVLIVVGGAGVVYAQVRNLNTNTNITLNTNQNGDQVVPFGYGPGGMMNGFGYGPGGMMNGYGYGPGGMMNGYGYGPGGMMGRRGTRIQRGASIMHDYMISAFAKDIGLTVEQVDTRLANGETLQQIAEAQGFTGDKLTSLATQVRQDALNQAVADGVITQAQADRMLELMKNYSGQAFGPGFFNCPMWDGDETLP